jgi:hypothetical protein
MGCTARELMQRMSCVELEERMVLDYVHHTEHSPEDIRLARLLTHLHQTGFRGIKEPKVEDFLPDRTPRPPLSNANKKAIVLGWARGRIARQQGKA